LSFSQITIVDYMATCVMSGVSTGKKLQREFVHSHNKNYLNFYHISSYSQMETIETENLTDA